MENTSLPNTDHSTENVVVNTENSPPTSPTVSNNLPQKRMNLELVLACLSLFISIFTFFITALQTNIMQKQQKASVWAYLEATAGISDDGAYIDVHNKGVGAAIVKEVTYEVKGKKFKSFEDLAKYVIKDSSFNYNYYSTNPINKKVFAPSEKIRVFSIKDMKYATQLAQESINIEIIYTDIYEEVQVFRNF